MSVADLLHFWGYMLETLQEKLFLATSFRNGGFLIVVKNKKLLRNKNLLLIVVAELNNFASLLCK